MVGPGGPMPNMIRQQGGMIAGQPRMMGTGVRMAIRPTMGTMGNTNFPPSMSMAGPGTMNNMNTVNNVNLPPRYPTQLDSQPGPNNSVQQQQQGPNGPGVVQQQQQHQNGPIMSVSGPTQMGSNAGPGLVSLPGSVVTSAGGPGGPPGPGVQQPGAPHSADPEK